MEQFSSDDEIKSFVSKWLKMHSLDFYAEEIQKLVFQSGGGVFERMKIILKNILDELQN